MVLCNPPYARFSMCGTRKKPNCLSIELLLYAAGLQTHSIWLREASFPMCLLQPRLSRCLAAAAALTLCVGTEADGGFAGLHWSSHCWKDSGLHSITATTCTYIFNSDWLDQFTLEAL